MSELGIIGLTPILIAFLFINYILLMQLLSVLSIGKKRPYLQDSELFFIIAIYITLWPLAPSLSFFSNHF